MCFRCDILCNRDFNMGGSNSVVGDRIPALPSRLGSYSGLYIIYNPKRNSLMKEEWLIYWAFNYLSKDFIPDILTVDIGCIMCWNFSQKRTVNQKNMLVPVAYADKLDIENSFGLKFHAWCWNVVECPEENLCLP